MDDYNFENENSKNENFPSEFAENNTEKKDVELDFSELENTFFEEEVKPSIDNSQNFINTEKSYNNGVYSENPTFFQPNYYSYQQGYQQNFPQNNNPFFIQNDIVEKQVQLYHEKKAVKNTTRHIGFGLILFFALQFVFSFILGFFVVDKESYEFFTDPAINLELNIILTLLGFGLASFFIFKTEGTRPDRLLSYGKPKKGTFLAAVMVGIGFCYVANISVSVIQSFFENIMPLKGNDIELPNGIWGFVLSVISIAVAPALLEELLFRGAIMGNLLKFGKGFAIFTSAFLFALVHGNLVQIPFAFMVGLILGILVLETDSIWTGVAIHFANNFISVCMDYLSRSAEEELLNIIFMILLITFIASGIVGIQLLSLKNKNLFSYKKTPHISTALQKFGWFSSSVPMIIYFAIIFFEVVAMQISA